MIDAIGFDLDNTLFEQWTHVAPFFQYVGEWLGAECGIAPERICRALERAWWLYTPAHPTLFDAALTDCGVDSRYVAELVRRYRLHRADIELYDGVREMLQRLSARMPLFLITDGHPETQRWKIAQLRIEQFFASIVVTYEYGPEWHKPSPRAFLHVAAQLGVARERCVFIGDNPGADIAGARSAEMTAIRVRTGPFSNMPSDAEMTVDRTVEVEARLAMMTSRALNVAAQVITA